MKKSLLFLVCCLGLIVGRGQGLSPSTVGEVFNFEVGDSFEYSYIEQGNCINVAMSTQWRTVIGKFSSQNMDTVVYYFRDSFWFPFSQTSHTKIDTEYHTNLNSFIIQQALLSVCDSFGNCEYDSTFIDSTFLNKKSNIHETSYTSFNQQIYLDTLYCEGLGATFIRGDQYLDFNGTSCHAWRRTELLFFHKVNGQIWPTLNSILIIEPQIQNIKTYPNPATNQLNISIDESLVGAQLNIYNITGALVQTVLLSTANSQLSTGNLPNGVYIAEIKTKEARVIRRWVKMYP